MAVSGHLLILLLPVFSFCEATEYYVRPTDPTHTSCPARPCLTLSEYVGDSFQYFKSNTIFRFLPGTHYMDRPVIIGNVYNITFEGLSNKSNEYPHLVSQFSCETEKHDCIQVPIWGGNWTVCCAAMWFIDSHTVTVRKINTTTHMSEASNFIFKNVSNITLQIITKCSLNNQSNSGIVIHDADSVQVYSSSANNCSYGLVLYNTTNTNITNAIAMYNKKVGIVLHTATGTCITDVSVLRNGMYGIVLDNMNNTIVTNITAIHNSWYGYGVVLSAMTNTHITSTTMARLILILSSMQTIISDSSFSNFQVPPSIYYTTTDPFTLSPVILLYWSDLHIRDCHFTRNHISALRAYASNITLSGTVIFSNNTAYAGTAFILIKDSILSVVENSSTYFLNNYATNTGGVFYIVNSVYADPKTQIRRTTCFINTEGKRLQPRFIFVNNSAGKGGDILYGGHVAFGFDGKWNCLDSFLDVSNISQKGLSLISSDPIRVCFCDETGQPDCHNLTDHKIHSHYPGQTTNIFAVVVGQNFGTVPGSVYAQFLQVPSTGSIPQIGQEQRVQGVRQRNCTRLTYTIFSQNEESEAVLVFTVQDSYVSTITHTKHLSSWKKFYNTSNVEPLVHYLNPYVKISLLPCPPGFILTADPPYKCDCNQLLQKVHGVQCYIQEQTIARSGLVWVGMIGGENGTNGILATSEYCSLDYCKPGNSNVTLSDPDFQCNFNHSGTLCGGCQPGLSLALGSAQCLKCSNKYLALLVPFAVAGPVLVFFIKLLHLTISQSALNGLIFYANVVKANEYLFLPFGTANLLTVFISWLNLDLGLETCFFQGLTAYFKTWLQFVFPFYIWTIAGIIIILAKYSDRVAKLMGNNSVPVLATLILLSYAKLFRTTITALSYTIVYSSQGYRVVWTADGNVDYLGPKHAILFAAAVAVLLFLWLPYVLLLFLGQWLRKCNCRWIAHMLIKVKPFLDAHYGPLKGKHCYWFGTLLLARATILLLSALIPIDRASTIVFCILVFAIAVTQFGHTVYNNFVVSLFETSFFMNLALLAGVYYFANSVGGNMAAGTYTLIGIAFAQFVGLILFKAFFALKLNEKLMTCVCKRQPLDDDWEPYEQAALWRERPSNEEKNSEETSSIENGPTIELP